MLPPPPRALLILGTDAAGKDYVANFLVRRWERLGYRVERREGRLTARPSRHRPRRKGRLAQALEGLFLRCLPWIRSLLRRVLPVLLSLEVTRFRTGNRPVLIVSQTALRLQAFLDSEPSRPPDLPASVRSTLRQMRAIPGLRVMLLRVDGRVRSARILRRISSGDADPFDRDALADPERALRFESCLVRLAVAHLGAVVVQNEDLDDDALEAALARALGDTGPAGGSSPPGT